MNANSPPIHWDVSDLRTRYVPATRLAQGLIQTAPWLTIVLLLIFFLLVPMSFMLQPGVTIELPAAPALQGATYGPAAVVLSLEGDARGERREIIFYNDQPYPARDERNMQALATALERTATAQPGLTLTIVADRQVQQGTLVQLYTLALKAGIHKIHIATRRVTAPSPEAP